MTATFTVETRQVDEEAVSLARRAAAGTADETDVRTQIAIIMFETDVAERAVKSALRTRYAPETLVSDLVRDARALVYDLCVDTSRTSALDLSLLVNGETSVCGWAFKVVKSGTRFAYDRMTVKRRDLPECDLGDSVLPSVGEAGGFIERALAQGASCPTHPTRTRRTASQDDDSERLLDAAEVQQTLMGYAVRGGPGWIETSTRTIIMGFGIPDMPRRLQVRTCRKRLLAELDADPRWAQNQLTALVCEREGERVLRCIDPVVRQIVGHFDSEALRDLAEHGQAADMICRYAATPRPMLTNKAGLVFRTQVACLLQGTVTPSMVSRLCNSYVTMTSELTAPERSVTGARLKSVAQCAEDRLAFRKTCLLILRKSEALGPDVDAVTGRLEGVLEHLLSDRTVAA